MGIRRVTLKGSNAFVRMELQFFCFFPSNQKAGAIVHYQASAAWACAGSPPEEHSTHPYRQE